MLSKHLFINIIQFRRLNTTKLKDTTYAEVYSRDNFNKLIFPFSYSIILNNALLFWDMITEIKL